MKSLSITDGRTVGTMANTPPPKKRKISYTPDDVISSVECAADPVSLSDQHATFPFKHGKQDPDSATITPLTIPPKKRKISFTPDDVISSAGCTAESLYLSDQCATFLLKHRTQDPNSDDTPNEQCSKKNGLTQSLLKLTLVPDHKYLPSKNEKQSDATKTNDDAAPESASIMTFLSQFNYRLTSESGAEYSYYDATHRLAGSRPCTMASLFGAGRNLLLPTPSSTTSNQQAHNNNGTVGFNVELIAPASERQIARCRTSPSRVLVEETQELYETVTQTFIQSIVAGSSLSWIHNVVEGKKEKERQLLDRKEWILNIDTKWRSHPDPFTVPRSEWYGHESTRDLYCLGIVKFQGLASLRDLRARHIPLLRAMIKEGTAAINKVYGVSSDQIQVFVHYQPQFYHFHAHFTRIANEAGSQVGRNHLLRDIIQNLEKDPDFYVKCTLAYALRLTDRLCQLMQNARKGGNKEKDG